MIRIVNIQYPEIGEETPSGIPLPYVDYSGLPEIPSIASPSENNPAIDRRRRFTRTYDTLSVLWVLTTTQFMVFKDFFRFDLNNGVAWFQIPLRFPKNTMLTEWAARFSGGFTAEHIEGHWNVQAELDLIAMINLESE